MNRRTALSTILLGTAGILACPFSCEPKKAATGFTPEALPAGQAFRHEALLTGGPWDGTLVRFSQPVPLGLDVSIHLPVAMFNGRLEAWTYGLEGGEKDASPESIGLGLELYTTPDKATARWFDEDDSWLPRSSGWHEIPIEIVSLAGAATIAVLEVDWIPLLGALDEPAKDPRLA